MIFFLFHIEIEGKGGWIIRGGPMGLLPPSQLIGGCLPPLPMPHSASVILKFKCPQLLDGKNTDTWMVGYWHFMELQDFSVTSLRSRLRLPPFQLTLRSGPLFLQRLCGKRRPMWDEKGVDERINNKPSKLYRTLKRADLFWTFSGF